MCSDLPEAERSTSWVELPENGRGRSWDGRPAGRTYAVIRRRTLAEPSPATSSTLVSSSLSSSRSLLRTGEESTRTSTSTSTSWTLTSAAAHGARLDDPRSGRGRAYVTRGISG